MDGRAIIEPLLQVKAELVLNSAAHSDDHVSRPIMPHLIKQRFVAHGSYITRRDINVFNRDRYPAAAQKSDKFISGRARWHDPNHGIGLPKSFVFEQTLHVLQTRNPRYPPVESLQNKTIQPLSGIANSAAASAFR